ncbi:ATP-dependent helicase [Clostridium sp. CM028]|uniref:ATP-dependent helicase n=1 Tax=Clostridium sp. CM028 TaxID=2851575 RepID=UPI001C6EDAF8|nr:ATP-dependent helicase [Clostridium sp. CM028]MBW9149360.1 ATP-dependent helicase [Clostridium sp. CM028]WLC63451.1 ATP-dependent helicase [Clostridium sp. CM028]
MDNKIVSKKINSKLSKEQKDAVYSVNRNLLVTAGPGSGKTVVIVNRIVHLINEKNVKPKNIIVITFTRAAAINMKSRYVAINGKERVPFFGTFHGLFYKILKNYYGQINIVDTLEVYKLIKNVLMSYLDEVGDEKVKEVINNISVFKTSGKLMENFSPSIDKGIFIAAYNIYEQYRKEKNLFDFDDLQIGCRDLFIKNYTILKGYRSLFKHILVDEFQDCDSMQVEILKLLNEENSIFAVGDEDQCIYGFRGSNPECMVKFSEHFVGGGKLPLSTNYRCPKNIVEISMNIIKNNDLRNEKDITAFKQYDGIVAVLNNVNENSQAEEISCIIQKYKENNEKNYRDNAILYRTNVECRSLIDVFIKKRIPFKLLDKEYDFFQHFICKDIIAYFKLSIDKSDRESFVRIINKPFRYISKLNLDKLKRNPVKEDCFEMLKDIEEIPVFQMKMLDKLKKDIHFLNKISLENAIDNLVLSIGYHDYIKGYCTKFKIDLGEMEDVIDEFRQSAEGYNSIITFLAHVDQVKEEISKHKKNIDEDAVILSTIHGVKGMEFENVYLINCNEENIPHVNSIDNNLEEERRLFYVGITRAINNVWLCISKSVKGKAKETSRFIRECNILGSSDSDLPFKEGDAVMHKSFGSGVVIAITSKELEIKFEGEIIRKFDVNVLYNNSLISKV